MMRYSSFLFLTSTLLVSVFTITSFVAGPTSVENNQTEEIRRSTDKEVVADFRGVAKQAIPAVVSIKVQTKKKAPLFGGSQEGHFDFFDSNDLWQFFGLPKRERDSQPFAGQASGVIVDPKGYILTNSHVVHDMDSIAIQLHDGREFVGKVLGDDPNSDLALVKIDAQDLPYLTLGNLDNVEVGQWVAAIGNPFGLQATLTVGVVSAKGRNNLDIARYEDFIQTDAAINRGNSGGPLVTLNGEVIGINTAIATNASSSYMGIGFAIPSNMAKHVMDEILSNGKVSRGLLGVNLQSIDYNLAKAFKLKKVEGALVANVVKNSAAEQAGLQVEDIILRYNDRPIENAGTLRNAVYMMKPGTQINLTVLRKDQIIQVPVTVGDYVEQAAAATPSSIQKNALGLEVENLSPEIAQKLGYTQDQGVIITKIDPTSAANLMGLKRNALILAVNRQNVSNVEDFNRILAQSPPNEPILLQVKQGENYLFISLQTQ